MRRLTLFALCFYLVVVLGCNRKPASDNANGATAASDTSNAAPGGNNNMGTAANTPEKAPAPPLVVPSGATVTVSLGSALGSKISQSGQTFTGTVAKDVMVGNEAAIPKGANVTGTVVDAKALGKFAGGAVLQIRLDSINVNGSDMPVQASARSFSVKGKGKRTGIMAGGGAALGGIIGGLAGGGKGAAIGLLAGGGAGGAGAAFTGNKDVVLPAESDVSFQLTKPLELKQ